MKILYRGRESRRSKYIPLDEGDVIELLSNNWDDFGYGTTFMTSCKVSGDAIELGSIKILVEGVKVTRKYFDGLLKVGWDGEFPISNVNYISVPTEISFYEQLNATIGGERTLIVAKKLKDASLLVRTLEDSKAKELVDSKGFDDSLQRERGAVQAYLDAWKIFAKQDVAVLNLGFKFIDVFGDASVLNLKYESPSPLPHDINTLIGANGSGKSQLLHQMVKSWISNKNSPDAGFVEKPNLSQIVVVSYSPFEKFPVDLKGEDHQDIDAYRYFGFRGRVNSNKENEVGRVRLSQTFPKRDAATSILQCLEYDQRYLNVPNWVRKLEVVERVLRVAFNFDFAAICVSEYSRASRFYTEVDNLKSTEYMRIEVDGKTFIPVTSATAAHLKLSALNKYIEVNNGVVFFKNGKLVKLSSGQRLFSYVVINILGTIRRSSLILVDEPELFLHPTLEIQFIEMLKEILVEFNSKALLATHSVVTVREMPADCVHVFERTEDRLSIKKPPFQTFGGDNQRISSYVFNDQKILKPFEAWIKKQVEIFGSAEALLELHEEEFNEEMIIQIKAVGSGQW